MFECRGGRKTISVGIMGLRVGITLTLQSDFIFHWNEFVIDITEIHLQINL